MSLRVFASLDTLPQYTAQIKAALRMLEKATLGEPGCLRYELYQLDGKPDSLHVFEEYLDEEAIAAHRAAPHYQAFRQFIADKLASTADVKLLRPQS